MPPNPHPGLITAFKRIICLAMLLVTVQPVTASELATDAMGLGPQIDQVLVRKQERRLYLMAADDVVRSYRVSLGDNPSGHKLFEGDKRTPEGSYILDWRNPGSDFYKSIHISYPNEQDRTLAEAWGLDPGGSIMIHGVPNDAGDLAFAYEGLDWTNGCIAVSNAEMDEIWRLV
ncbi:MAG: L,D-transpeptidase family protein, partial [Oleiphilaceae bacterium]|nr:L,D-transpeptidase family protein [Oleiphilaceae bacterium]